jgi:vacuolar protein sorting-associated protein 13A/C
MLEQSSDKDYLMARVIRIYVPYWISFARLPPLTLQFIDITGRRDKRRYLARPRAERSDKILYDIEHEELVDGYTIASGLNFKGLGLSACVCRHGGAQFGALKELSPLGDMVSLDPLSSMFSSVKHIS